MKATIICLVLGVSFVVAGVLFFMGKLHERLRSWKEMSVEERSRINVRPLCHNAGFMIVLAGFVMLVNAFWSPYGGRLFSLAMTAWIILCGFDVWFISKSKRYVNTDIENHDAETASKMIE